MQYNNYKSLLQLIRNLLIPDGPSGEIVMRPDRPYYGPYGTAAAKGLHSSKTGLDSWPCGLLRPDGPMAGLDS